MNLRFFASFASLVLLLGAGCARADRAAPSPSHVTAAGETAVALPDAHRALVVTVDVSLRVASVTDATTKIRTEAESAGGYVSSSNAHGDGDDASATMDVRVPVARASSVRKTITGVGEIVSESEKVDDVTEQRADLTARLHNARTEEARLAELMQQKTGNIADVLVAEKELARVRETVERLEAEQRTLDGQIDLATIHVALQTATTASWHTPGPSIARAWSAGVKDAEAIAVYLAMGIAAAMPTLFPIAAFVIAIVVVARRRKARALA